MWWAQHDSALNFKYQPSNSGSKIVAEGTKSLPHYFKLNQVPNSLKSSLEPANVRLCQIEPDFKTPSVYFVENFLTLHYK